MRDIIFYLLLGLLLYYILSRFIENYSLEQENFDPSLVPVSSIVTLAKVAQKLVTGGVLTNPGSLQIGTPNAGGAGNLVVTGNTTVNGNTTLANVKINPVGTTGNTIIQYGDGTGKKVVFQKDDANPQLEIFDNKKVNVKGELNVEGIFKGNNTLVGTNPGNHGQTSIDGGKITIGDPQNSVEKSKTDTGTNLNIQGKDGGGLKTSNGNHYQLKWNDTGVTATNLTVLGSLTTSSISETINTPSNSVMISAPSVSISAPNITLGIPAPSASTTTINGDLKVNGVLYYPNIEYPIDPCGYFMVRGHAKKSVLYYGWNMLWSSHDWAESLRLKQKWNGTSTSEQFVQHISYEDRMGNDTDVNWSPRYLVVKPGFKITLYTWDSQGHNQRMVKQKTYLNGEHTFEDYPNDFQKDTAGIRCNNGNGRCNWRVHIIAVQLVTDTWTLPANFPL